MYSACTCMSFVVMWTVMQSSSDCSSYHLYLAHQGLQYHCAQSGVVQLHRQRPQAQSAAQLTVSNLTWLAMQEYPMFHTSDGRKVIENLDEFDDAREVVAGLAAEYQACERADYVSPPLCEHAVLHGNKCVSACCCGLWQ